jgi:hypothetical protein
MLFSSRQSLVISCCLESLLLLTLANITSHLAQLPVVAFRYRLSLTHTHTRTLVERATESTCNATQPPPAGPIYRHSTRQYPHSLQQTPNTSPARQALQLSRRASPTSPSSLFIYILASHRLSRHAIGTEPRPKPSSSIHNRHAALHHPFLPSLAYSPTAVSYH